MASGKTVSSKKLADARRIHISEEEFRTGSTNFDNIQVGVEEFQTHGFVILENAIADNIRANLYRQMRADEATYLTFPDLDSNHGNAKNNFSMTPPLSDEFLFEEIWANRHAAAIMQHIIGPRPLLCWASSNIAKQSPPDAREAVHSDAYTDIPNFPFCVEMNIYLQDTMPENGSPEIWPGTHVFTEDDHVPTGRGLIKKKSFTNRARTSPPIQPTIPAGSILIRDLRLWHAGMPNTTANPRIVMSLLFFPQWFRPLMRLTLPQSIRAKAELWTHIDLVSNTDFVEGPIDYLHTHFAINFTQDPEKTMVAYQNAKDIEQGRAPGAKLPITKNNYWTPSKYQTRAASNRKRQAEGDDNEEKERQKRKMMKSEAKPIGQVEPELIQQSDDKPKGDVKQEMQRDKKPLDDLPDYEDSPQYPPDGMKGLLQVQAAKRESQDVKSRDYGGPSTYNDAQYLPQYQPKTQEQNTEFKHETKPEQDLKQPEDSSDYEHSQESDVSSELWHKKDDYEETEQAWVLAAQKSTFKRDFMPYAGSGPGMSPKFSPKWKPDSLNNLNKPQETELQNQRNDYVRKQQQQPVPVAKMVESPRLKSYSPNLLTKTQLSRPPIKHVSPYCASSVAASSSTLPRATPATDAYGAYTQAQPLGKEHQEPEKGESKTLPDEKTMSGAETREKKPDPDGAEDQGREWLSVEEDRESKLGQ